MKSNCVLLVVLVQLVVLMCETISFAGTWRDDFEDRITREWKIYNLDRQVENWWVNDGEAVGRIFKRGFISLWLTGKIGLGELLCFMSSKIDQRTKRSGACRSHLTRQR